MNNFCLSFLIILCIATSCFSQIDTYDISDYRRPNLYREQLNLFVNLNLTNNNNNNQLNPFSYRVQGSNTNEIIKSTFENSDSIQGTSSWSANAGGSFEKMNDELDLRIFGGYNLNKQARHYKQDNKFLELEYDLRTAARRSRSKVENQDAFIDNTLTVATSFKISKGKGRFEYVTDAWHASTILEELDALGLLKRSDLDHQTITEFADKIAIVKNRRFTDPRFFFINEYEEVIEFLDQQKLIDTEDLKFFGHFYDLWRNERFISRRHGKTFRYGIGTSLSDSDIFSKKATNATASVSIEFEDFKAISKDWQFDKTYGINVISVLNDLFAEFGANNPDPSYSVSPYLNLDFGYYPNFRTNYTVGLNIGYIAYFDPDQVETGFTNDDRTTIGLSGVYNYYVSPQFTWRLSGSISLRKENFSSTDFTFVNTNRISFNTIYSFF